METKDFISEERILYLPMEVERNEEYEDVIKWGFQKMEIPLSSITSEFIPNSPDDLPLKIQATANGVTFTTYTPKAYGYIAPIFLWSFLNQILDYFKPDNEFYFFETYAPAIVFLTKQEFILLVENKLTWVNYEWSSHETSNQIRFKRRGKEITEVTIHHLE